MSKTDAIVFFMKQKTGAIKAGVFFVHVVVASIIVMVSLTDIASRVDFQSVYHAAVTLREGGAIGSIYQYDLSTSTNLYRYFPFLAIAFIPLTYLGEHASYIIISAVSIVSSLFATAEGMKIVESRERHGKSSVLLAGYVLLNTVMAGAYFMGNIVVISLAVVMLALRLGTRGNHKAAAFLLGLSIVIKPVALFVVALYGLSFLLSRQFKRLLTFAAFVAIPLLPDAMLFAFSDGLAVSFLGGSGSVDLRPMWYSVSAASFSYYAFSIHFIAFSAVFFPVALFMVKPAITRHGGPDVLPIFAFGSLFHFIFLIDIWYTQFPVLMPFIVLLFILEKRFKKFMAIMITIQAVAEVITIDFFWVSVPLQLVIAFLWCYALVHVVKGAKDVGTGDGSA